MCLFVYWRFPLTMENVDGRYLSDSLSLRYSSSDCKMMPVWSALIEWCTGPNFQRRIRSGRWLLNEKATSNRIAGSLVQWTCSIDLSFHCTICHTLQYSSNELIRRACLLKLGEFCAFSSFRNIWSICFLFSFHSPMKTYKATKCPFRIGEQRRTSVKINLKKEQSKSTRKLLWIMGEIKLLENEFVLLRWTKFQVENNVLNETSWRQLNSNLVIDDEIDRWKKSIERICNNNEMERKPIELNDDLWHRRNNWPKHCSPIMNLSLLMERKNLFLFLLLC